MAGNLLPNPQFVRDLVEEDMRRYKEDGNEHPAGHCLVYTLFGMLRMSEHGYRPTIQSGTMAWPIVTPEQDDGVSPTHFSYEWDPEGPTSKLSVSMGRMPEFHSWLGMQDPDTIVDFTTGGLVAQWKLLSGNDWPGLHPPDYLWSPVEELPAGVVYRPHEKATAFVVSMMMGFMRENKERLRIWRNEEEMKEKRSTSKVRKKAENG